MQQDELAQMFAANMHLSQNAQQIQQVQQQPEPVYVQPQPQPEQHQDQAQDQDVKYPSLPA